MRLFRPHLLSFLCYHEAFFRIKTSRKVLFLTFDDGPDPESTPVILDILDKMHVKAVFFCNGNVAEMYPELIEKIRQRGHMTGNHGYYHLNGWKTAYKDYLHNTEKADATTSDKLFRPPYGKITYRQYRDLKKRYKIIFWDLMAYDFDGSFGPDRSAEVLKKKIRPGSIIVLHDSPRSNCRCYLEEFIRDSVNRGYIFNLPDG